MLGPRQAVIQSADDIPTTSMEAIPLVEPFRALSSENVFDNVSSTFVARVGVVSLETYPHRIVRVRGTINKHLANGAE
jgi:hypothetical protein